MTKQKHSGMAGRTETVEPQAVVVTSSTNAYDHNTNTGMQRATAAAKQQAGAMAGDINDLKVVDLDWEQLGLDPAIHGQEVAKIAGELMQQSHTFDPSSYGTLTNYEANTRNTNKILDNLASSDMDGASGQILSIVSLTKEFSRDVQAKPGFLARLMNKGKNSVRDVREKYDTVSQRLDSMVEDLGSVQSKMQDSSNAIAELDGVNKKEFHATSLYIAAGRFAFNQMVGELNAIDADTGLPVVERDFKIVGQLHGLEKRLHDLELSQVHRRQQTQQYGLILQNNDAVINKLTSVTNTLIPAWRSGITTTLAIQNIQKSATLVDSIQDASDAFMLENSRMLKQSTAEVAALGQRSLFDVNVLTEVQQNLEESIQAVVKIQHDGAISRNKDLKVIRQLQSNIDKIAIVEVGNTIKRVAESAEKETQAIDLESRVEQA